MWTGEDFGEEFEKDIYPYESPEEVYSFILTLVPFLIERVIPETPRVLTLEKAGKCLRHLGKIWNLSEYPQMNICENPLGQVTENKLMDMEGFVEEYQFLHIEAVDLALTNIKVIPEHFVWLLSADLSGNRLTNTSACPVTKLPNIVALRLNRNRFEDPYLPPMKHLQYLGLNSNKITSLHRIYHPNLETLDLNFNLIDKIDPEDCWKHTKLKQLELRGNRLTTTSGIEYSSLTNLYLAKNNITKLEGFHVLVNLERLHLRDNPLSDLTGFSKLNTKLKYLNIRKCYVEDVQDIKNLEVLTELRELILIGNMFNPEPEKVEEEDENLEDYQEEKGEEGNEELRIRVLSFLPRLIRIDKKLVTKEEQKAVRDMLEGVGSY